MPYHGCQSVRSLHIWNAANVHSPIAPRAPGNPATLIDKHTNMGEYQFRCKDTSKGDSLLWRRPALDAVHDEKRIPGGHCLYSALEPSGCHRCDENETNLNHSCRAKQGFLELFSSSSFGSPLHAQQTQPRHTNSQALVPLPIDPNIEIYDAEGKTLPRGSSLSCEIIVCSLREAQTKMRHSMQKRSYYRF
jgi:hypothetical protein